MTHYHCPRCGSVMHKRTFRVGPVSIPIPGLSSLACETCGFAISAANKFVLTLVIVAIAALGVLLLAGAVLIALVVAPPVVLAIAIYWWWMRRKLRKRFGGERIIDVTVVDDRDALP